MFYPDPTTFAEPDATKECPQCGGSGIWYGRGYFLNGVFKGPTGPCFACNGKGRQTLRDAYRNKAWVRHNIGRLA